MPPKTVAKEMILLAKSADFVTMSTCIVIDSILVDMLLRLYLTPPSKINQSPILVKPNKLIVFLSINLGFSLLFLFNALRHYESMYSIFGIVVHIFLSSMLLGIVIRCSKKGDRAKREWCNYERPRVLLPLIFTTIIFMLYLLLSELRWNIINIKNIVQELIKKKNKSKK